MTIHRQFGRIVFECTECEEVFDTRSKDFDTAWDTANREGWVARKINGEWVHFCPECQEKKR